MTREDNPESSEDQGDENPLLPPELSKLDPEEALRGFMETDPEKVKERLEEREE